jgi:general secretion pathway protein A
MPPKICSKFAVPRKSAGCRQISASFDLPPQRSFQRQMDGLERQFADAYTSGRNVIILLDDAQLMSQEALEVIHRLYNFDYDAKVVQILAFGQSEMNTLFETIRRSTRAFFVFTLPSPGQRPAMVVFRLRVAGRNDPLIDDEGFELLYEKSQGVPREIIRFCAMATDHLLESDETMININIIDEVA